MFAGQAIRLDVAQVVNLQMPMMIRPTGSNIYQAAGLASVVDRDDWVIHCAWYEQLNQRFQPGIEKDNYFRIQFYDEK
jgi:hypothetical protein